MIYYQTSLNPNKEDHAMSHPKCARTNTMHEAIHETLQRHPNLRIHPKQAKITQKISAFVTSNGRALALDNGSNKEQPIWVEAHTVPSNALQEIKRDFYTADAGRNSNLHKLPGFKDGALIRLYPQTVSQALQIVDFALNKT